MVLHLHLFLLEEKLRCFSLLDLRLALSAGLRLFSFLINTLEYLDDKLIEFFSRRPIDMLRHILNELLSRHHHVVRKVFLEIIRYLLLASPCFLICANLIHKLGIGELTVSG